MMLEQGQNPYEVRGQRVKQQGGDDSIYVSPNRTAKEHLSHALAYHFAEPINTEKDEVNKEDSNSAVGDPNPSRVESDTVSEHVDYLLHQFSAGSGMTVMEYLSRILGCRTAVRLSSLQDNPNDDQGQRVQQQGADGPGVFLSQTEASTSASERPHISYPLEQLCASQTIANFRALLHRGSAIATAGAGGTADQYLFAKGSVAEYLSYAYAYYSGGIRITDIGGRRVSYALNPLTLTGDTTTVRRGDMPFLVSHDPEHTPTTGQGFPPVVVPWALNVPMLPCTAGKVSNDNDT